MRGEPPYRRREPGSGGGWTQPCIVCVNALESVEDFVLTELHDDDLVVTEPQVDRSCGLQGAPHLKIDASALKFDIDTDFEPGRAYDIGVGTGRNEVSEPVLIPN